MIVDALAQIAEFYRTIKMATIRDPRHTKRIFEKYFLF